MQQELVTACPHMRLGPVSWNLGPHDGANASDEFF